MSPVLLICLLGLGLCILLFSLCFLWARKLDNYSIVDPFWALSLMPASLVPALLASGWWPRRLLLGGLLFAWSLRLGLHLWKRAAAHHPREDARYAKLRLDWSRSFSATMFGFYQLQALSVALLCLPLLPGFNNTEPAFSTAELFATLLFAGALFGESLADRQLERFKASRQTPRAICNTGLWGLSRHPNYFFECLAWFSLGTFCLSSSFGIIAMLPFATITFLLTRMTGIPPTEAHMQATRGKAFLEYKQKTRLLVPLPRF